jgi:hypothetical protein
MSSVRVSNVQVITVQVSSVRVSSVRVNRGEGVAGAVATIIAIGSPPSEKMPKVRTLRKNG